MATSFDTTLNNLGIGSYSSTSAAATPSATGASGTLGQADFLKLMTAQLNNQDPFNPVDNTQMVAQMAQFSSVAGISQMNTTLTSIADKLNGTSTSDALSYVGKTVLTPGDTAYARTSGGIAGAIELGSDATDVNVTISDQSGSVLKTMSLGAQSKGTINYDWDGTTNGGTAAGSGPYKISVTASNAGTAVTNTPLVWAPVASVSVPSTGNPTLNVTGLGTVAISDVRQVG
jgi:flagellar basal-body rod modification protein FlgD